MFSSETSLTGIIPDGKLVRNRHEAKATAEGRPTVGRTPANVLVKRSIIPDRRILAKTCQVTNRNLMRGRRLQASVRDNAPCQSRNGQFGNGDGDSKDQTQLDKKASFSASIRPKTQTSCLEPPLGSRREKARALWNLS